MAKICVIFVILIHFVNSNKYYHTTHIILLLFLNLAHFGAYVFTLSAAYYSIVWVYCNLSLLFLFVAVENVSNFFPITNNNEQNILKNNFLRGELS